MLEGLRNGCEVFLLNNASLGMLKCTLKSPVLSSHAAAAHPEHQNVPFDPPHLQVFKAVRSGVQPVAVKVLNDASPKHLADFQREITILRGLQDSNVVQFQGLSWREGRMLLVTEFMAGAFTL